MTKKRFLQQFLTNRIENVKYTCLSPRSKAGLALFIVTQGILFLALFSADIQCHKIGMYLIQLSSVLALATFLSMIDDAWDQAGFYAKLVLAVLGSVYIVYLSNYGPLATNAYTTNTCGDTGQSFFYRGFIEPAKWMLSSQSFWNFLINAAPLLILTFIFSPNRLAIRPGKPDSQETLDA